MRAISDLVRRLKRVVGGADEPAAAPRSFDWQPAAGARTARDPTSPAKPAEATATDVAIWKKPAAEASSVIGATIPADVADLAVVYRGAGVSAPAHGYGVDRVAQMLAHKSLAGLDPNVKASAVLAALDAAGVRIQEVIHDGLLRHKALVAFEAAKELEFLAARPRHERRREELKRAMTAFQQRKNEEIEALSQEATAAAVSLQRLKSRQRAEEDRFHRTVSLFVEALPARIVSMPKPESAEPAAAGSLATRPNLKLVEPAAVPLGDQTLAPAPLPPKPEQEPS